MLDLQAENRDKELTDLEATVRALKDHCGAVEARSRNYEVRIATLQREIAQAEAATEVAQQQLKANEEKLESSKVLLKGKYDQLVKELFEEPKQALLSTIQGHARWATVLTIVTTVIAIVVSAFFSLRSPTANAASVEALHQDVRRLISENTTQAAELHSLHKTLNVLSGSVTGQRNGLGDLQKRLAEQQDEISTANRKTLALLEYVGRGGRKLERVQPLSQTIQENSQAFSQYSTLDDTSLAYKVKFSSACSQMTYEDIRCAMQLAGMSASSIPKTGQLQQWDRDLDILCMNAVRLLSSKPPTATHAEPDCKLGQFATSSDKEKLAVWGWHSDQITNGGLLQHFENARSCVEARMALNRRKD